MCGICGLYEPGTADELRGHVERMTRTLAHRGPDGTGVFARAGIALGHRRLSVIDLSEAGDQPMTFGATTVVHNGEVFNFTELRRELELLGHRFVGHSDTEVLLHTYAQWGLEGLERLEGLFAFALWDAARERLVLVRDRLGIKPMFYAWSGNRLAFGSELKAILAGLPVGSAIDDQALAEYLWYGNAFEDRTIYRDIRALPAGGRLVVERGRARLETWWRIETWLAQADVPANRVDAAEAVRRAVDAAVGRQLVSDVPVGLFLSGGIDSSTIAASAAVASRRPLVSYSVGFDYEHGVNELSKARQVARQFGMDHHELHVQGTGLEEILWELARLHDEPFADAANIPLYLLAKELRGTIKVVLQGDGGDETFAGYRRYSVLSVAALWRLWPHALEPLLEWAGGATGRRLARLGAAAADPDAALRMALLLTVETRREPPERVLTPAARQRLASVADPFMAFRSCARRFAGYDPVQQMLLTDLVLQLPSQFLAKVDRATMAHGIEARVPLLDEHVAALAVRLPASLKVRGAQRKIVLRDAMRARLPREILDGPKTGFGVPYEEWLRTALHGFASSLILAPAFVERFGLDGRRVRELLDLHRMRRRNCGFLLWKLLQLALWTQHGLT